MQEGQPTKPAPIDRPSLKKAKAKQIAILTLAAALVLSVAYAVGRLQTSKAIDAAESETAEAVNATKAVEQTLASERNTIKKLEARRQLHLALLALDKRNFGIAQEHVDVAARLLNGHVSGDLEAIRSSLSGFRLLATEDLEVQRAKVLDWAGRFDVAMPPIPAE